jgi:hypothetical protein
LALSVIILSGARDSGKSDTLKRLIKDKLRTKWARGEVIYSFKGKRICIYTSSPQEQGGVGFCKFKKVNRVIHRRVKKAKRNKCTLLITPFTMGTNRMCELNTECITKPIDYLAELQVKKVHLAYLRRDPARGLTLMNHLMKQLRAHPIIESGKGKKNVRRQANKLWKLVMQVDL